MAHTRNTIRVALVSGGHPFDVPGLVEAFQSDAGLQVVHQHMDDWVSGNRSAYDVVVFYHMLLDTPAENGGPWYAGNASTALAELGATDQGIVVLHHALLAYPKWEHWSQLVGIADRTFGYHLGNNLKVRIADRGHPITRGLDDFELVDETYTMADPSPGENTILLSVEHPQSMKHLAWTRTFGRARVFCYQSGHDRTAFDNPQFRRILSRGIRWVAPGESATRTIPPTTRAIFYPEKGRMAFRDLPSPVCEHGTILCESIFTGLTNGTERNMLLGGNYAGRYPIQFGYQNIGRVLEVGTGVSGFHVGDVIFSGDSCSHMHHFLAPAANPDNLIVKVPANVAPQAAALFGMASVSLHDVRRARVGLGENVLVVGAGLIGQFTSQAARATGAVVTIGDLDARRLDLARSLGAHHTIHLGRPQSWADVAAHGPFDVIIETSGADVLRDLLGRHPDRSVLRPRGRLALIAGRFDVTYPFNAAQGLEVEVLHAGHFFHDDLVTVARLVSEGVIRIEPLLQDAVPVAEAAAIYERLRDQPQSLLGTVFDWR